MSLLKAGETPRAPYRKSTNRRGSPQIQKDHRESQRPNRDFSGPEICGLSESVGGQRIERVPHRFRRPQRIAEATPPGLSGPEICGLFESVGNQRIERVPHRFRKTTENRRRQNGVSAAQKSAGLFESVGGQRPTFGVCSNAFIKRGRERPRYLARPLSIHPRLQLRKRIERISPAHTALSQSNHCRAPECECHRERSDGEPWNQLQATSCENCSHAIHRMPQGELWL